MTFEDVKAKVKPEGHKKVVTEHIQYICDQARERNLNVAEIILTKLQNGQYLEEKEVEEYAKENNLSVIGNFYIANELKSIKISLVQPKQVVKRK